MVTGPDIFKSLKRIPEKTSEGNAMGHKRGSPSGELTISAGAPPSGRRLAKANTSWRGFTPRREARDGGGGKRGQWSPGNAPGHDFGA